jgi:tetratricopeptide (TPR) repeat protein
MFRTLLASSYQNQGRFSDAEQQLRTALKRETTEETLVQLGHVLLYQKKENEAIPLLSRAVELDPADAFGWLYLGLACERTGRAAEARRAHRGGLSAGEQDVVKQPRSSYNRAVLAYLCAQSGQVERAAIEAAEALQLSPRHNDTLWVAALTYERLGNRAAALKTLENAPRTMLDDMRRWPEASALSGDAGFTKLLSGDSRTR